jgi:hypothetical protein
MSQDNATTIYWMLLFVLAVYGVGLRLSQNFPFLKLTPPARVFAWVVEGAARSRLRKRETLRDWFVYREGEKPGPNDLAWVQFKFIGSFVVMLIFALIAI